MFDFQKLFAFILLSISKQIFHIFRFSVFNFSNSEIVLLQKAHFLFLDIPKSDHFTDEEHVFSKALELVLKDDSFKKSVITNKELLLQKYNIEVVANEYLS